MPFKAIIIDDEQPARELVKHLLAPYNQVEIVAECSDGFEGIKAIGLHKPHLVFLDIQMPRINGFEMLELLDEKDSPQIIFTTAYDQFALKAFEHHALDYLLKPLSEHRFAQAMEKAIRSLESGMHPGSASLKDNQSTNYRGKYLERIVLRQGDALVVIPEETILYLEAVDDYVKIVTLQKEMLKKKTLKYFEENLNPELFIKVHRSYLVRVDAIQKIEAYSKDSYLAFLKNGHKVSVSKAGYANLRQFFR